MRFIFRKLFQESLRVPGWLAPTLLTFSTSILYIKTLLPGLGGSGDTAKFQFIGKILGVPHAPGYPLYVLLNWLFVHLPLRSVAFRANLMSAFFAVLTVLVLYHLLLRLVESRALSFWISLLFALSLVFWSHAVVAEVYTLNSFLLVTILLSLVRWKETQRPGWLYLFLVLYPLSFANHLTMITLLPAIGLFFICTNPGVMMRPRFIAVGLLGGTLTLGFYSYLFIRSFQRAPYLEHRVVDWKSFFNVISAEKFRSAMFPFSPGEVVAERIPMFFHHLATGWPIPLLAIAALGLFALFKKDVRVALLLGFSFLGQSFYILNYDIPDLAPFFIPTILLIAPFAAAGLKVILMGSQRIPLLQPILIFGLILGTAWVGLTDYPRADRSSETLADLRLTTLLASIPAGSILITDNYLDKEYVYSKMFLDFPNKGFIHLEISSDAEDIRREIYHQVFWKIRASLELQKRLFPETYRRLSPDQMETEFRHNRALQSQLLSHVYPVSTETVQACTRQGLKVIPFRLPVAEPGRKFTYYQLFLL